MEARTVPREAPDGARIPVRPQLVRLASDERLVALVRCRHPAAFEVLYERYHHRVLSFCRHVLGDAAEAEDVGQHTFLAAWNDLTRSDKPIQLRAWLFTIARNRCLTVLRGRRERPTDDLQETATEGLATIVQRRQDLRDLVTDLRGLPDEQRTALVLAEIDALGHNEIAQVLGVPRPKVKALVFQARESLLATRTARETDCTEIRRQLATERGGGLRRSILRRHLRECSGCRAYPTQAGGAHSIGTASRPSGPGGAPSRYAGAGGGAG
jgi:RNA polymerase sigma factor (sigma-70 family)